MPAKKPCASFLCALNVLRLCASIGNADVATAVLLRGVASAMNEGARRAATRCAAVALTKENVREIKHKKVTAKIIDLSMILNV